MSRSRSIAVLALVLTSLGSGQPAAAQGRKFAILVGIKQYDHSGFSNLYFTERDVVELSKVLKPQGFEVALLTDSTGKSDSRLMPTRANILAQLDAAVQRCRRDDMVLFGFAGHGVQFKEDRASYFCPVDARPNNASTMVSLKALYDRLDDCNAGVKLVLVDACRVEVDKERFRGLDGDNAPPPPRGVSILFSCKAGQAALESNELQHGLFFYHVLEGLRGKAKNDENSIAWQDLASYAARKVQTAGHRQVPVLKGEIEGVPILVRSVSSTRVETKSPPPMKTETPKPRALAFEARHGISSDELQRWADALDGKNLRPTFASVCMSSQGPLFSAIAVEDPDRHGWWMRINLGEADFQRSCDRMDKEGYRMLNTWGYYHNGIQLFAGVWVKDGRARPTVRRALTSAEYQRTVDDFYSRGYRPAMVSGYAIANSHRLNGIFVSDNQAWLARHDITADEYQKVFDDYVPKGYRPISITAYPTTQGTRFGGVFIQDELRGWVARSQLTSEQYQKLFDDLVAKGHRPTQVVGYPWGNEIRYAAVFIK